MFRIRKIDHLVLRVSDLNEMLQFYCTALGCTVERRQDAIGLVQLRAGRSLLDLVPVDDKLGRAGGAAPGAGGGNLDHFCFASSRSTGPPFDRAFASMEFRPVRSRRGTAPRARDRRYMSPTPKATWSS